MITLTPWDRTRCIALCPMEICPAEIADIVPRKNRAINGKFVDASRIILSSGENLIVSETPEEIQVLIADSEEPKLHEHVFLPE